jgi:hypothetical protein
VGGDVDADGIPDLLLGLPCADDRDSRSGRVVVISGRDGTTIRALEGTLPLDGLGVAVAFLGDLDADGHDDYAIGAAQTAWDASVLDYSKVSVRGEGVWNGGRDSSHMFVRLPDGTERRLEDYVGELLAERTRHTGFLTVRSGKDGAELYRVNGDKAGHGFARRLWALGDLDGDGRMDLGVAPLPESDTPIRILSGRDGTVLESVTNHGFLGAAGDVDADGRDDYFMDAVSMHGPRHEGSVRIVSGRDQTLIGDVSYPEAGSVGSIAVPLGDVDGDGYGDIGLGSADYFTSGPHRDGVEPDAPVEALVHLREMTLEAALSMSWEPGGRGIWDSGMVSICSGRTREVLCGIWGDPRSAQGMGLGIAPIDDVDGDGLPDLVVSDASQAYVFAGPGRAPDRQPR